VGCASAKFASSEDILYWLACPALQGSGFHFVNEALHLIVFVLATV
jgi:hypothetical protein